MTTGKQSAAGTQNEVVLFAYGDFGHAGPIVLGGGDEGFFQAGDVDEFKVNVLFNDALNTFYLRLYVLICFYPLYICTNNLDLLKFPHD